MPRPRSPPEEATQAAKQPPISTLLGRSLNLVVAAALRLLASLLLATRLLQKGGDWITSAPSFFWWQGSTFEWAICIVLAGFRDGPRACAFFDAVQTQKWVL